MYIAYAFVVFVSPHQIFEFALQICDCVISVFESYSYYKHCLITWNQKILHNSSDGSKFNFLSKIWPELNI